MSKRSRWMLAALTVIVALPCAMYGVALAKSKASLRQAYAALEKDGRPMVAADVMPVEGPDAENAAVLYARAASLLRGQRVETKELLEYLSPLCSSYVRGSAPAEKVADLRRWMGQEVVERALAMVEQGTRCPGCRFGRRYDEGLPADLPIVQDIMHLACMVGATARLELEAGDSSTAWNTVAIQARLADSLRNDPVTPTVWSRMGLINFTCLTIQSLCEVGLPAGTDSQRIEALLKDLDDTGPLVRVMDGERLLVAERVFNLPEDRLYSVLKDPLARGGDPMGEAISRLRFRLAVLEPRLIADHAAYLGFVRRSTLLLERPPSDGQSDLLTQFFGQIGKGPVTMKLGLRVGYMERLYRNMAAMIRVTRAGLAALRYREIQGALPQTLEVLNLKGLVDPYDQASLRYRPEGNGFVVYSVGEDLKDNRGTPRQHNQTTDYDLGWRFADQAGRGESNGD